MSRSALSFKALPLKLLSIVIGAAWCMMPYRVLAGQSLQTHVAAASKETSALVNVFAYVAFVSGIVLGALGIQDLRRHIETPSNAPLKNALAKLGIGGMLLALPAMTGFAAGTMGAGFAPVLSLTLKGKYQFGAGVPNKDGLSGIIANATNNAGVLVQVAAFAAFIIGVFFVLRGLQLLRAHIENPSNSPLPESLKRLAVGGALLTLPVIANVVMRTFGARGPALASTSVTASSAPASGLDGMLVRFVGDIAGPAYLAIEAFCYIAGVLLILFAMQRLVRTAQDGARGPLGFGTITTFVVAGLLLSFPGLLATLDLSLLGHGKALTKVTFMASAGLSDAASEAALRVVSAVLAFMAVVGFLSVVRGLFLLKAFADGSQQATMMSVVTHILAGSLAINLGGLIKAVQATLGVELLFGFQ